MLTIGSLILFMSPFIKINAKCLHKVKFELVLILNHRVKSCK